MKNFLAILKSELTEFGSRDVTKPFGSENIASRDSPVLRMTKEVDKRGSSSIEKVLH